VCEVVSQFKIISVKYNFYILSLLLSLGVGVGANCLLMLLVLSLETYTVAFRANKMMMIIVRLF